MKTGVYLIINLINGKVYVGSAAGIGGFSQRWRGHRSRSRNKHLDRAFKKYGTENFVFEPIEFCSPELCIEREQYWIDWFKDWLGWDMLYNICENAGNTLGIKFSDEHKKKLSLLNTGEKHPQFGKKKSEETRKKISETKKGTSPWNKGKTGIYSDEARKRMSEARKDKYFGENCPRYKPRNYRIINDIREKRCTSCGRWLEEFVNFHKSSTGHSTMSCCKDCHKRKSLETRKNKKAKVKENKNGFGKKVQTKKL